MFKKAKRGTSVTWVIILTVIMFAPLPLFGRNSSDAGSIQERLERGEVVVSIKDVGNTKYVTGQVLINEPPDKVWPIMVNPFEFQGKITPRMKTVEVMADQANRSVLKVTLDVLLIPHFTYTVESLYQSGESVKFRRIGGMLKDFRGSWIMVPANGGSKTELTYCMYIDPGFLLPQWMIREGVKNELPKTLIALRQRVSAVSQHKAVKERRTILAAFMNLPHLHVPGGTADQLVADNKLAAE